MSQESVAELVHMHELHPEAGVGNVRIRHGSGDKNLRVVSAPVVVEFVEPLPICPDLGGTFGISLRL